MSIQQVVARPNRYLLLAGVSLGGLLVPLNSTMLAVALPNLRRDFDIGHAEVGWLISAYLIAMAVAQPIGGRLGDQLGRSRVFRAGLFGFLLFSLAATLAPNFITLVLLRTGQAVTGGAMMPNGMAMLRETVPVHQRGQINGLYGSVMGISAAVGPLVGAALLALGSWRLLFLLNVPFVALAVLLQTQIRYRDTPMQERPSIDWLGALLFAALLTVGTFLLGSLRGGQAAVATSVGAAIFVAVGVAFVLRQFATPDPTAEWRLFRNRSFAAATSQVLLTNLVMYTTLLAIPFFIREVQEKSLSTTGLLLGAMSILMALVAPISGRLSDVYGRRWPAFIGSWIAFAGAVLILTGLSTQTSFLYLAVSLGVLGLGVGMSVGSATTAAVEAAPQALAGAASGTNSMMRYVGSILGAGILAGILNSGSGAVPGIDVFRVIMAVVAGMAALAIVAAAMIHRFPSEGGQSAEAESREASAAS